MFSFLTEIAFWCLVILLCVGVSFALLKVARCFSLPLAERLAKYFAAAVRASAAKAGRAPRRLSSPASR